MDDEAMTEADVVALMGAERFNRLRQGGWLSPFYRLPGHEGRPRHIKHLVDLRHQEDLRLHPEGRRPAVVAKAFRGTPDVEMTRDGQHRVVFRQAGGVSPRVKAELQSLLALARRVLGGGR
jgi:hypothetical protein